MNNTGTNASSRKFLFQVLLVVVIQLCITYYVMNREKNPQVNPLLSFVLSIAIIVVLAMFHTRMPAPVQFLLFAAFSYLFGLMFYAAKQTAGYSRELINEVVISTISVFVSMGIVGFALLSAGIQLGLKTGIVLMVGLLAIIVSRIALILMNAGSGSGSGSGTNTKSNAKSNVILSALGIFLFSGYVIYDTNTILQGTYYRKNEHVRAALSYYLDFVNLFSNGLNLSD